MCRKVVKIMDDEFFLIFDGVCNLCESSVIFIIKHDKQGKFRFASAQSEAGLALQNQYGIDAIKEETLVLVKNGNAYTRSSAAVRIARELDGIWKIGSALWLIPRPLRDAMYKHVARNRYQWYGQKDQCMVPSKDLKIRFLG